MSRRGERLYALLLRLYPREFRARYQDDLLAFFRQDRDHPKHGHGRLRPVRFWLSTLRDLARTAWSQSREARGSRSRRPLRHLRADARSAWRGLWSAPGVTCAALVVLTLGIGAGTAIFSVVDAVALRGLPFPDDHRLVAIEEVDLLDGRPVTVAAPNYFDWRERQTVFESMGASARAGRFTSTDEPAGEVFNPLYVTASLFSNVLRVSPAVGRPFRDDDEGAGAERVAIISDGLWRRRFGGRPDVVGQRMAFENGTWEVIGVMPPGFAYPVGSALMSTIEVWIPFVASPRDRARDGGRTYNRTVVGRLRPGATIEQAAEEMSRIRDALALEHPRWFVDHGVAVMPLQDAVVRSGVRSWMLLLLAAVGGVLLVACLNVASLLLARAAARGREVAVRAALGASRWDLGRALIVESLMLSLIGAAGGVLMAFWGVEVLRATLPDSLPRLASVAVDLRVLSVAAGVAVATGLAFGTLPALASSHPNVATMLREGGRSQTASRADHRLRSGLVLAEVALAVVMLAGAGLFMASFTRVMNVDLGFDPENVLWISMTPRVEADTDPAAALATSQALVRNAVEHVRALPGVAAVSAVSGGLPLSGNSISVPVQIPGRDDPPFTGDDEALVHGVTSSYLDVIRGELTHGRWIADSDHAGSSPVVVLNDEAVRLYFQGGDPIGQDILLDEDARTIVGIIRGMRHSGPERPRRPAAFVPFQQDHQRSASVVIRASAGATGLVPQVRAAIRSAVPGVTLYDPQSMEQHFARLVAQRRFNMTVLVLFGALAMAIASVGIYGLMAFLVAQRTREIGVRMALGAIPGGIVRMVLARASRLMLAGLVVGLASAAMLERSVRAFLFEAEPHDPAVYGSVALALLAAGLLAALGPARRAARVDPLIALRAE